MPEFRYSSGDAVSLNISEAGDDSFDDLVGSHPHSAHKFYCFVPQLPPIDEESDGKTFQVLAVQVTLFEGRGVCIGMAIHHSVCDAPAFLGFITAWASITKFGGDDEFLIKQGESLPVFDRSLVKYPPKLDAYYWSNARKIPLQSRHPSLPTDRIRATYVFSQSEISKLKHLIQAKVPSLVHLSSFVAIAAYIWSGIARSVRGEEEEDVADDDDDLAFFLIPMDLRARLDPAVPGNYFGNCLSYALPRVRRRELVGDEGVFVAAAAMAAEIKKRANDKRILESVEEWSSEIRGALQKSYFSVAGSSRLDLYGADFGWGKVRKQEILSIDGEKYAMSLCQSRDSVGGFEVCLSLPNHKMDAFAAFFSKGINNM